jgi:hypothetical protein
MWGIKACEKKKCIVLESFEKSVNKDLWILKTISPKKNVISPTKKATIMRSKQKKRKYYNERDLKQLLLLAQKWN